MQEQAEPTPALLAIDPGEHTGWALLTIHPFSPSLLSAGTAITADAPINHLVPHILEDATKAGALVRVAVIEDQYVKVNPRSSLLLAKRAGRWWEACLAVGLNVTFCNAQKWQNGELRGLIRGGTKQKARKAASKLKAKAEWRVDLKMDAADAAIMGRYVAIQLGRKTWAPGA